MSPIDRNQILARQLQDLIDNSSQVLWAGKSQCAEHESQLPAMDLYEIGEWLTIELELPGLRREAIEVLVEGQAVLVTAMKTDTGPCCEVPDGKLNYQQVERKYGRYCREIRLPVPCNTREGRARYVNGVLIIEFKKLEDRRGARRRLNVE
jgi:HSP20 family molecular chaperone IbpA